MKKQFLIGFIVLVLAGGGVVYMTSNKDSSEKLNTPESSIDSQYPAVPGTPEMIVSDDDEYENETSDDDSTTTNPPAQTTTAPKLRAFTLAEVQKHATASDCYSIVGTKVYDLTTWISKHPGGEKAILSICGKDGTGAFEGQHGGQAKQEAQLAAFYVGEYSAQ